jgi:hypothetical protein
MQQMIGFLISTRTSINRSLTIREINGLNTLTTVNQDPKHIGIPSKD